MFRYLTREERDGLRRKLHWLAKKRVEREKLIEREAQFVDGRLSFYERREAA
jgi:hypothetical protein